MELRDYQEEAVAAVSEQYKKGVTRQLIVLPTGTGKTVLIAAIVMLLGWKTLILAHREELIQQAREKILAYWPEADIGICKAHKNELEHTIVIGSVQTCCRPKRLKQLKKRGFAVLIIDEAHHAPADSYLKVVKKLGFMSSTKKLLVGLTATPERHDKRNVSSVFQEIVYARSISEMINGGHLSSVIGRKITTDISLDDVKSYRGDFVQTDLAKAINIPKRNKLIAAKYKLHAHNRKGIAFCVNVQHCHDLAVALSKAGISAKAVWGEMPMDDRRAALAELRSGKIQVLTSCGILTEGYDESSIECIVMARSTRSKSLYIQCVGRGLRPFSGKENCLVLDFADSHHNLNALISLGATIPGAEIIEENSSKKELCETRYDTVPIDTEVIEISDEEFDLLRQSRFAWVILDEGESSLVDRNYNEIVIRPIEDGFRAELYRQYAAPKLLTITETLSQCRMFCDDYAAKNLDMTYADLAGPHHQADANQDPTPKQKESLISRRLFRPRMSKADASLALRKSYAMDRQRRRLCGNSEPITEKQKIFLERLNISVSNITKKEAQQMIAQIIKG